jgi:hypothetical protein
MINPSLTTITVLSEEERTHLEYNQGIFEKIFLEG